MCANIVKYAESHKRYRQKVAVNQNEPQWKGAGWKEAGWSDRSDRSDLSDMSDMSDKSELSEPSEKSYPPSPSLKKAKKKGIFSLAVVSCVIL